MRTNTRIFPRIHPRLFRREDDLAGFGLVDSGALLVFHAAWADAAGVSQTLLTGTSPVTTDHAEAILSPDHEGTYVEFGVDEPVWAYGRVTGPIGSRVVHNTDDVGDYLIPQPYLVAQPEGTNSCTYSRDLTNAEWTTTTADTSYDQVGLEGVDNTASLLGDSDPAAPASIYNRELAVFSGSVPVTAVFWIKQFETSPAGNTELVLSLRGVTRERSGISINLNTLDYIAHYDESSTIVVHTSSVGDWAVIYIQSTTNDVTNTDTDIIISPCRFTLDTATTDNSLQGSITVGNIGLYVDKTIAEVKSIGPTFTTSAAASTSAFDNEYPAANHSNTEGPLYLEFENTGDDVVLMSAGTDEFLKITSNQLILDDGTTQLQAACAAGEHKAGVAFAESRGDEEVTNGEFDTDILGWTDFNSTSSWDAQQAISISYGGSASGAYQAFPTVIGKTYIARGSALSTTGVYGVVLRVGNGSVPDAGIADSTTRYVPAEHEVVFVAIGTTSYIYMRSSNYDVMVWDNVSVKEVTNKMNLNLDGTWADLTDSTAYDGTLGSGALILGDDARNVKRWNETDLTKQKDIIDREMA